MKHQLRMIRYARFMKAIPSDDMHDIAGATCPGSSHKNFWFAEGPGSTANNMKRSERIRICENVELCLKFSILQNRSVK